MQRDGIIITAVTAPAYPTSDLSRAPESPGSSKAQQPATPARCSRQVRWEKTMASRPELDQWLASADERLDDPVLVGRRLGVVPQERGRQLEIRYGAILGDDYLQLVNVDPATGRCSDNLLVRGRTLNELRRHLAQLAWFLGGTAG